MATAHGYGLRLWRQLVPFHSRHCHLNCCCPHHRHRTPLVVDVPMVHHSINPRGPPENLS